MSRKGHRGFESLSLHHGFLKVKSKNMFKKIAWFSCLALSATILYADEPFAVHKHPSAEASAQYKDMSLVEETDAQNSAGNKMFEFIDYVAPTLGFINGYAWKCVKNQGNPVPLVYAGVTLGLMLLIPVAVTSSKPSPQITDDLTLRAIKKIESDTNKEHGRQVLIYGTGAAIGVFVQSLMPHNWQ